MRDQRIGGRIVINDDPPYNLITMLFLPLKAFNSAAQVKIESAGG